MPEPALQLLEPGVYAWIDPSPAIGRPNAGAVIDADGVSVIDTLMVSRQFEPFGDAVDALGHPVRRVVLSSAHVEFAGGTSRFRLSAVYGTRLTSSQLDIPPNIDGYKHFMPEFAGDFEELQTRPVSHLVDGRTWLTPAIELIPVSGYTPQNLLVLAPGAGVLFAGGMCSFGVTPLCFQADLTLWADALDLIVDLAPTIVPGHGPIGGADEVRALQGYLRACVDAGGDPSSIPRGPWDAWPDRRLDRINVERAAMLARGEDEVPKSMLQAIGMTG